MMQWQARFVFICFLLFSHALLADEQPSNKIINDIAKILVPDTDAVDLTPVSPIPSDVPLKGAACFISDKHGRVLVTEDILSGRYAMPGGHIEFQETPAATAKRETFEETGLDVEVIGELARSRDSVIFDCQSNTPIAVYLQNIDLGYIAAWKAPHFSKEVKSIFLMRPSSKMLSNSRYPEQVGLFSDFLLTNHPSELDIAPDFSKQTSVIFTLSSDFNFMLQRAVNALPSMPQGFFDVLLRYSSAFGSGLIFFILLPIALATGGSSRGAQLLFAAVTTTTLVTFGKLLFAAPRPMHIFPELILEQQLSGFAFPSGHTATAFAAWGLVYLWYNHISSTTIYIWLFPGLLTGLSRVYLGAHHMFDVIAGMLVGVVVVYLSLQVARKNWLLRPWLWGILGSLLVPLAVLMQQPAFIYCGVFCFSYCAILSMYDSADIDLSKPLNLPALITSFIGLALVLCAFYGVTFISSSSIDILLGQSLCIALLSVWIGVITPRTAS